MGFAFYNFRVKVPGPFARPRDIKAGEEAFYRYGSDKPFEEMADAREDDLQDRRCGESEQTNGKKESKAQPRRQSCMLCGSGYLTRVWCHRFSV